MVGAESSGEKVPATAEGVRVGKWGVVGTGFGDLEAPAVVGAGIDVG